MTIFISHATEDDSFVTQLRTELHARGFRTWVDHFDIPAGENWIDVIEEALAQSLLLVLVISPNSLSSHFVRKEWGVFLAQNRRIIPLMVEECEAPMMLRDLQHIVFTDKTVNPAAITQLVEVLPKKQTGTLSMPQGFNRITDLVESPVIPPQAGEGLSQKIQLVFPDFEEHLSLEISQPLIIGRSDPDAGTVDIDLSPFDAGKRGVSRRHALLRYTPQGVIITDLSSKNGTFVDDYRVSAGENFVINSGAQIRLGVLEFQIVNVDDKTSTDQ
jgi:pSer/pThr/pTyr-binding forkhead associated (FHA) protein